MPQLRWRDPIKAIEDSISSSKIKMTCPKISGSSHLSLCTWSRDCQNFCREHGTPPSFIPQLRGTQTKQSRIQYLLQNENDLFKNIGEDAAALCSMHTKEEVDQ
jgi:hypothetical protein